MRYPRPVPGSRGMSIRPFAIVLVAAALGLTGAAPSSSKTIPPTIRTQPTFFISGHGWGHGLGMSQYGAYGYAQHGWTYDRIVNVVDLDFYIRGVVPSEMPKTWAPEALKAQAVAARSYALSHLHAATGFDLYPDTRDQVYLGIPHEAPSTNAAVNATAGQVV